MMTHHIHINRRAKILLTLMTAILAGWSGIETALAAPSPTSKSAGSPAADTVRRYAEALAKGDHVTVGQLDFACQFGLVAAAPSGLKAYPPAGDPSYESCWQGFKTAHAPALKRDDAAMTVLWPSAGPLVFFRDELARMPASAFVMEEPVSYTHLTLPTKA